MNSLMDGESGIYRFKRLDEGEKGKQTGFQQGDSVFKHVARNRIYNSHDFRILACTDLGHYTTSFFNNDKSMKSP